MAPASRSYVVEANTTKDATDAIGTLNDLTAQDVRDAMKLAPTAGDPAAGSVDIHLDNIEEDTGTTIPALEPLGTAMRGTDGAELSGAAASAASGLETYGDSNWATATGFETAGAAATAVGTLNDLTAQEVRDAMKLTPSAGVPAAGSVDIHLDNIEEDTGTTIPALPPLGTAMRGTDNALLASSAPTNFGDLAITATTGRVDVDSIEGVDATNQIRDAVVDDSTRIDASALNTLSGHDPGGTLSTYAGGAVASVTGDVGGKVLGGGAGSITGVGVNANTTQIESGDATDAINAAVDDALNTAVPGSPTADSINERIKTLDDNYTSTKAGYIDTTISSRSDFDESSNQVIVATNNDKTGYGLADGAITNAKIATDAIGSDEIAASAITEIQSGLATSANQTTILNRIGAFTGNGVNTILGFFKALFSKDASTPSDVGGTFSATTDSTDAIRDRGDTAWITGSGGSGGDATAANQTTILANIATVDGLVDTLIERITAQRATNLDELGSANIPTDIDTLLSRLSAARAGYLDELGSTNIPADIDTLTSNISTIDGIVDSILADTGTDGVALSTAVKNAIASAVIAGSIGFSGDTDVTVGQALQAAWAQGKGNWEISGTSLTLYEPDTTTVVATFILDDADAPTSRMLA